jgi:hypothetical protein
MKQTCQGGCHCGAVRYAALPVVYVDGRNDDFQSPPAATRHL